jgi:hypothetical protein
MHGFVAAGTENGGTENLVALLVDDDFHEPLRLAFLNCPVYAGHRPLADTDFAIGGPRLGL